MSQNKASEIGFRTESYSGSLVRDLSEIIMFEMAELRNDDIPVYVLAHFTLSGGVRQDLIDTLRLRDNGEYPFLVDRSSLEDLIDNMLSDIRNETGKDIRYGLWLASKDGVKRYLCGGGTVDRYPLSEVILSDLGPDGRLYAFDSLPVPL